LSCGCVELRRNGEEVVDFTGYKQGFVLFGVDGFESWIAGRIADEEIEELGREERDETSCLGEVHPNENFFLRGAEGKIGEWTG